MRPSLPEAPCPRPASRSWVLPRTDDSPVLGPFHFSFGAKNIGTQASSWAKPPHGLHNALVCVLLTQGLGMGGGSSCSPVRLAEVRAHFPPPLLLSWARGLRAGLPWEGAGGHWECSPCPLSQETKGVWLPSWPSGTRSEQGAKDGNRGREVRDTETQSTGTER